MLYYTHKRKIFERNGVYLAWAPFMQLKPSEKVFETDVAAAQLEILPVQE